MLGTRIGLRADPTSCGLTWPDRSAQLSVMTTARVKGVFDRASKPIAVHLSCDDFVDFPIEMKVDGHLAYVPPDWLPLSDDLIADLRAYQALWEQLPLPEEDPGDGGEIDDEDDDDLEFEKVWRLIGQLQVSPGSDPDLARRLAQDAEARAADLDESERQALLPQLVAAVAGFDLPWARALVRDATTLARGIDDPDDRARAIVSLVTAVAGFDPDEAEALARDLPDPMYRDRALMAAVEQMSRASPDRAESLANSISHPGLRARALSGLADPLAIPHFSALTETLVARLGVELGSDFTVRAT